MPITAIISAVQTAYNTYKSTSGTTNTARLELLTGPNGLQTAAGNALGIISATYVRDGMKNSCADIDVTLGAIEEVRAGFENTLREIVRKNGWNDLVQAQIGIPGAIVTINGVAATMRQSILGERAALDCGALSQVIPAFIPLVGRQRKLALYIVGAALLLIAVLIYRRL